MGLQLERVVCMAAVAKLEVGIDEVKTIVSNFSPTPAVKSVTR
jgi:hypothetical protein